MGIFFDVGDIPRIDLFETDIVVSARKKAGITTEQAAEYVGVATGTIRSWEHFRLGKASMPKQVFCELMELYSAPEEHGVTPSLVNKIKMSSASDRISQEETEKEIQARTNARVSQREAGRIVGLTHGAISCWESEFYWDARMPREIYNTLMDYYKNASCSGKKHKVAIIRHRITNEQTVELSQARKAAGVSTVEAGRMVERSSSVIFGWEASKSQRGNAPIADYEVLMSYYRNPEKLAEFRKAYRPEKVSDDERLLMIQARHQAGLTAQQAADMVGCKRTLITQWENAHRANAPREQYNLLMEMYANHK